MDRKNLILGIISVIIVILLIAVAGLFGDDGSSSSHERMAPMAPMSQETPLSSPFFESLPLKITCGLRYHDYYNSIAHGAKASPASVSIVVIQNNQATTYENTNSIELDITKLSTSDTLIIEVKVIPSNPEVLVVVHPVILSIGQLLEGSCHISYDFSYPKDGLAFPLTHLEREAMSSIVALEHGGGPAEAKRAVAKVILNRRRHGYGSIYNVIFSGAFTTAKLIDRDTGLTPYRNTEVYPYNTCKKAVDHVSLYGLEDFPHSVVYFRSEYFFDWAIDYKQIGSLYFSHNPKYM